MHFETKEEIFSELNTLKFQKETLEDKTIIFTYRAAERYLHSVLSASIAQTVVIFLPHSD